MNVTGIELEVLCPTCGASISGSWSEVEDRLKFHKDLHNMNGEMEDNR